MTQRATEGTAFSDRRLLIYAVIALIIVGVATVLFGPDYQAPALSTRSITPDGAMALRLWLEQSGYTVHELLANPIRPGREDALFILNPLIPYTKAEAITVRDWVRSGHTLVITGNPFLTYDLLDAFNVSSNYLWEGDGSERVSQAAPVLLSPPFERAKAEPVISLSTTHSGVTVHAYSEGQPLIISFAEGQGIVWVFGVERPFTNRGLHDGGNAAMVLNVVSHLRPNAVIAFDEARHGYGETRSAQAWLFNTPPGWGVLIAIGLLMVFLVLRGRRFGRAVPLPNERLRREPVEYIQAMANLFRRSGQRGEMLKHYRGQLRRRLSERYAIDPHLSDIEMVKTIVFRDPAIDEADLRDVLSRLTRKSVSETELIRAASDVDRWLRKLA